MTQYEIHNTNMCGIIGYIGKKQAREIVVEGLKRLEYRGYDSAGIALLDNEKIFVHKDKGKISQLATVLSVDTNQSTVGIGHTRWATHGEPNQTNAHPHLDCKNNIAVVHNGIVENYVQLKEKLLNKGHRFLSCTDSEVIAHLIEDYLDNGNNFIDSIRLALSELEGTYALVIISSSYPDKLIAARNGSPLIIGLGEKENFVASDIPALLNHTKNVVVMDDYQLSEITSSYVKLFDLQGNPRQPKIRQIEWSLEEAEKLSFPHYMLKEIYEQPVVIRKLLNRYINEKTLEINFDNVFLASLSLTPEKIGKIKRIIIQACGTSYHAGSIGKYLLEKFACVHTDIELSSEFRYQPLITNKDTILISITQSGETTDTLMGLRKAKSGNLKTLSVCNVVDSSIARESEAVIYTHAGPEIGVASTKAYTAQMLIMYLLSIYLAEKKGLLPIDEKKRMLSALRRIPSLMEKTLHDTTPIIQCAESFSHTKDFLYLGRNLNYPTALEGALKLKEIAYVHASAHPAGEMKHGPIALIDETVCIVTLAPYDDVYEKMVSNIQEVEARKGNLVVIATEGNTEIKKHCHTALYVPEIEKHFYPLLTALPLQLFAYYIANNRGCEIDQPRNLAKSVTVE